MTTLWTVLVPLVQHAPDPSKVKPGWLGFGVVLVLMAAVVLLGFGLSKHLRRANQTFGQTPSNDAEKKHPTGQA